MKDSRNIHHLVYLAPPPGKEGAYGAKKGKKSLILH